MDLLGLNFDVIELLQLAVTITVVGAYLFAVAVDEKTADFLNKREMTLLAVFVADHHPDHPEPGQLAEATESHSTDDNTEFHWFSLRIAEFRKDGSLVTEDASASSSFRETLLAMVVSPFALLLVLGFDAWERTQYRVARIRHTSIRRNYVGKCLLFLIGCLVYLYIGVSMHQSGLVEWAYVAIIPAALGIIAAGVEIVMLVYAQHSWKHFWVHKLLEIMAQSTRDNDHDVFNRALGLKEYVESEPDFPIPSGIGVFITVFSILQAILLWVQSSVTA